MTIENMIQATSTESRCWMASWANSTLATAQRKAPCRGRSAAI